MARYIYVKETPAAYREALKKLNRARHRKRDRFFFGLVSLIGASAIIFAILPFLAWQISTLPKLTGGVDSAPVPEQQILSAKTALAASVQVIQDPDGFSYFVPVNAEYNEATQSAQLASPRPQEFFITIPKLKIKKAKVKVDSLKFDTSLSHFPGSAIPGEIGNAFITGHSVLPQFADPKNYRAIFTKLSDLEVGDDVYIQMDDQTLHFSVQYSKVVDPRDLSVLLPISATGRNLTLMTCVPPGTNIKRLVVITSLI